MFVSAPGRGVTMREMPIPQEWLTAVSFRPWTRKGVPDLEVLR